MVDQALVVLAEHEELHDHTDADLWNESFYLDCNDKDETIGVYVRIGRTPNQGVAVYTAAICEKGKPAILIIDQKAPLPDRDNSRQYFKTKDIEVEFSIPEPLKTFRVTNKGAARSFEDHAGPFKGQEGEPIQASFDLTWHTDGVPFHWRHHPRYEIPCHVTGTVTIGDRVIDFAGPGQRDHSYGDRDWWSFDWTWFAFHFEDGTHMHGCHLPIFKNAGEGYVQKDGELFEGKDIESTYVRTDDGLITEGTIKIEPGGWDIKWKNQATGALFLTRDDGREDEFPRQWVTVENHDGRKGSGWHEINFPRGIKRAYAVGASS